MKTEQLALVRGWDDTRVALRDWHRRPAAIVLPWVAGSLVVAALLLAAAAVEVWLTPHVLYFLK